MRNLQLLSSVWCKHFVHSGFGFAPPGFSHHMHLCKAVRAPGGSENMGELYNASSFQSTVASSHSTRPAHTALAMGEVTVGPNPCSQESRACEIALSEVSSEKSWRIQKHASSPESGGFTTLLAHNLAESPAKLCDPTIQSLERTNRNESYLQPRRLQLPGGLLKMTGLLEYLIVLSRFPGMHCSIPTLELYSTPEASVERPMTMQLLAAGRRRKFLRRRLWAKTAMRWSKLRTA